MKNLGRNTTLTLLALAVLWPAWVQAAGTSAAQFLKMGAGARAAAMGDSYVSVADDATAAYWNPAGLAQIQTTEIALMHNSWLQDTDYQYFGAAKPFGKSALGVSLYRLDYGTIDSYSAGDVKGAEFDAGSMAASLTFGTMVREGVFAGATAKYISETIESESASSLAGDFGVLFKGRTWKVAAVLQNVGPGLKMVQESFKLPQTVRVGISRLVLNDKFLVSAGLSKPNDNDLAVQAGTEYQVSPMVAVRAGYNATPGNSLDVGGLTGLTGGLGFKFGRMGLDYSIAPFGDLGLSHRLSFRMAFISPAY